MNIRYDYHSNLFFCLDNVSNWSHYTRSNYRKTFLEHTVLGAKELSLLEKYVEVRNKYSWTMLDSWVCLPKDFEEAKEEIIKNMSEEEAAVVLELMVLFDEKFRPMFDEAKEVVEDTVDFLKDSVKSKKFIATSKLIKFFLKGKMKLEPDLHLFLNISKKSEGGGANFSNEDIALEIYDLKGKIELLQILMHEYTHVIDRKLGLRKKIEKLGYNSNVYEGLVDAISNVAMQINYNFDERGIKARMNDRVKRYQSYSNEWGRKLSTRTMVTLDLYDLVKGYMTEKKKIDTAFFNKLKEKMKEFEDQSLISK